MNTNAIVEWCTYINFNPEVTVVWSSAAECASSTETLSSAHLQRNTNAKQELPIYIHVTTREVKIGFANIHNW